MTISRLSYTAGAHPSKGSYDPSKLEKKLLDRVEPLFEVDADEPVSQVSLSYSRLPDGSALISRVTGRTAQALYLARGVEQLNGQLPLDLWRSPVWEQWGEAAQSAPEPGPRPKPHELIDYAREMNQAADGRLERFLADVRALFAPTPGRQIVVVADDSTDVVRLIRIACASLPAELAARLTFNTRCIDPYTAFQQIVGVRPQRATTFTEAQARHQYRVHNLLGTGVESPAADEPDPWARKLAAKWLNDGVTPQEATNSWIRPHADTAIPPKPTQPPTVTSPAQQQVQQKHDEHEHDEKRQDDLDHKNDLEREPATTGRLAAPVTDLAKAGIWDRPPTRSADPKPLFDAIKRSAPGNLSQVLAQFADVDLGEIPADVARALGEHLRTKPEFVTACEDALAALLDRRLLAAAFRDLESVAKLQPHGMLTGLGFQAMAIGPLREQIPDDCGRLRFLIHAARLQRSNPESAPGPTRPTGPDPVASAHAILRILRAARLEPHHGEGATLATILSLYWPDRGIVPSHAAVKITADLRKNKRRLSDDEALRRLAEAVLMAPSVDDDGDLIDLANWLLRFRLSQLQDGALNVLTIAAEIEKERSTEEVRRMLDLMIAPLRDGDGAQRSDAVAQWWTDRTIDALFRSPAEELWISAVPTLVACDDKRLLRRYRERVCAPDGPIEVLARNPEILDRADTAWSQASGDRAHWTTTRHDLLKWVEQMRKKDRNTRGRNRPAAKPGGTR